MGLRLEEYNALTQPERETIIAKTARTFKQSGADFTIQTIRELPELIERINNHILEGKRPHSM